MNMLIMLSEFQLLLKILLFISLGWLYVHFVLLMQDLHCRQLYYTRLFRNNVNITLIVQGKLCIFY